jgi:hypothetical protein
MLGKLATALKSAEIQKGIKQKGISASIKNKNKV